MELIKGVVFQECSSLPRWHEEACMEPGCPCNRFYVNTTIFFTHEACSHYQTIKALFSFKGVENI